MTLNYTRADAATDTTVHAYWSNDLQNLEHHRRHRIDALGQ